MIEQQDIICFGPSDWWFRNPSCTKHIMRQLAERNRVLYVNAFNADLGGGMRRGLAARAWRKIRSLASFVRKVCDNLYTISPVFVPLQGTRAGDQLNNFAIRNQIRLVARGLGMRPSMIWYENPRAADALDWFRGVPSLYHVSDAFADCTYTRDRNALRAREQRLTDECDVLVCVSHPLLEQKRALRGDAVHFLPHGVEYERFAQAAAERAPVPELDGLPRPIVGYYGTLTAANDIALLEHCAMHHSDKSFVFAGSITGGDYRRLQSMPNTRFLGFLPYERMAPLAAQFDVCLLPWRMSPWIEHCNPLKFLEFMAAGRPIVSVPIPHVRNVAEGLVSIAATPAEFAVGIQYELENDTPERAARRQAVAQEHSWARHADHLAEMMAPLLNGRSPR